MTPILYPLRFVPTFRQYIWGGRRLGQVLDKPIGDADDYAESWEVVDHGEDQSVVAYGALKGMTLNQLVAERTAELMGTAYDARNEPIERFPLLFKLLDCNRNLSVQVHPNDEQGQRLDPPDLGKTEAWVILDAEPGSRLYAGLKPGIDQDALSKEVARGTTENCLHAIEPEPGDCVFIPAGTVHALGEGLLVAEIQQASDTTFRLFDWNRVGADGQPRQLHVRESLETIDYSCGPVSTQQPQPIGSDGAERLVECDKFVLDRWRLTEPRSIQMHDRFRIIAVIEGEVTLRDDPAGEPLRRGQTALLPACLEAAELIVEQPTTILMMSLPQCN